MILPIIMAGGTGSRLWPLSRELYPKQFLSLSDTGSMLQQTMERLNGIEHQAPFLICNEEHRFIVAEQLRTHNHAHSGIILEPVGRNTAPAITLAAIKAIEHGDDPLLLVLPADHLIRNSEEFEKVVQEAANYAEQGAMVTFGIVPTSAETGYGYIKKGQKNEFGVFQISAFVEKPNIETAQSYLRSGDYFWNSGMFMFKASRYIEELKSHQPKIFESCTKALKKAKTDLEFIRIDAESFVACPSDSIDYAVMEPLCSDMNSKRAVVVPLDAGWSDVGSWSALWEVNDKDKNGNSIRGDVLTTKTKDSYIYAQNKLVATVGVDNLIVVETKDAVLVACKEKVQEVKDIVKQLKKTRRLEYLQHREVYRPWGKHDAIADGERFHVKHLTIKPGERTATQMHYHRAEHWIVVSGTAKVTNGSQTYLVEENKSTFIPVGAPHSIGNPGKIPLVLIEVRSGGYLEEDDVVRVEEYGAGY